MPATYTHNKFAKEIYKRLNEDLQDELKDYKNEYELFSQSFDNLYFYKFYTPFKGKKIRKLGSKAHKSNVNKYFKNILTYMLENNSKPEYKAYLYGSLAHYILDSKIHPYIFYKTGIYKSNDKNTYKYNGLHTNIEFMIDAIYYNYDTKKSYKNYNLAKEILPKITFTNNLKKIINYTFENTFDIKDMGNIYNEAYNDYKFAFKNIYQDKSGLKKALLKTIDKISTNRITNFSGHNTNIKYLDYSVLNIEKKRWNYPSDNSIIRNLSVIDLFNEALEDILKIINNIELLLKNEYTLDKVLIEIGNKSYTRGIDCELRNEMIHFEF